MSRNLTAMNPTELVEYRRLRRLADDKRSEASFLRADADKLEDQSDQILWDAITRVQDAEFQARESQAVAV